MNTPIKNKELLRNLGTSILTYLPQTPEGYVCLGYGNSDDDYSLLVQVYNLNRSDLWATDSLGVFHSGWVGADDTRLYFITVERMKKLINDLLNPVVKLEPGQVWKNDSGSFRYTIGTMCFGDNGNKKLVDWWCLYCEAVNSPDENFTVAGSYARIIQYLKNSKGTLIN